MLPIRIGPSPIEYVFTIGMRFGIEGTASQQLLGNRVLKRYKMGRPAGLGHCAAAVVQGTEVLMPHKGRRELLLR